MVTIITAEAWLLLHWAPGFGTIASSWAGFGIQGLGFRASVSGLQAINSKMMWRLASTKHPAVVRNSDIIP